MRPRNIAGRLIAPLLCLAAFGPGPGPAHAAHAQKVFRAGAGTVDIAPRKLPVIVNGGFLEQRATTVRDALQARGLVLDDGSTRLALVVVDSCMLPRELIDRAKQLAHEQTGLRVDRMLVSATHTHSAPAAMGALGSRPDPDYVAELPGRIAEVIARAVANLEPAEVGWAVVDDFADTHCRNWIRRPDRMLVDPFGERTVRANMHPGYENPDVIGPSGPVDPGLSVLAVRSAGGRPLAVLANYAMHYFGAPPVSADYYGLFAVELARLIAPGEASGGAPFVAMMSQGTSGDQHWMDYARPKAAITIDAYAQGVAQKAHEAYRTIKYLAWVPLRMAETRLTLGRRLPDERRLDWARKVLAAMGDREPKTQPEVYAREAFYLHDEPVRELKLQAIRIGELGIAAIPDEVFALTGLKIKAQSPLAPTSVIELANGSEGYIPPPELHALGGYNTWPARTAGLEVQAEPKIVAAVMDLLEEVAGAPRRTLQPSHGAYANAVLGSRPLAYWRLEEMAGPTAADATGHGDLARFKGGTAFYLEGPGSPDFSGGATVNRAVHLAGGHLDLGVRNFGKAYSVELWFWNGLPSTARAVTGTLLSRSSRDQLIIGGTRAAPGRLALAGATGMTEIVPRKWYHVVYVRSGENISVYLNGKFELEGHAPLLPEGNEPLLVGGSMEVDAGFEGKVDEVSVYDRELTAEEAAAHFRSSWLGL